MTSSSPSPDPIIEAGFAKHEHEGERLPLAGPFVSDMRGPLGGVYLQDMPMGKPPARQPRKIKGLPGPTTGASPDYEPGQGTWRDAT